MTSSHAGNLTDYLERIAEYRTRWVGKEKIMVKGDANQLWFRGQHDSQWGLTPKIYRPEFSEAAEAEIRQEFQSRAMQMIQGRFPASKWEWYFLMQHYGAPTRLLDWTDSPMVALFFALHKHKGDADPVVWVLDPWWLNKKLRQGVDGPMEVDWNEADAYLLDSEKAFTYNLPVTRGPAGAIEPPHIDRRVAAQRSRFVIFGKVKDITRTRAAKEPARTCRLAKIIIPNGAVDDLRDALENAGFTISSIFPDLEGLCQELCDRWIKKPQRVRKTLNVNKKDLQKNQKSVK
jgi:hypothetical protein